MSGPDPNSELEKFRQQWKRELHQKNQEPSDPSPAGTSRSVADGTLTPTHQVKHFSDYSLPPVNAELAQNPLKDDNSCDGFEINTFKPQTDHAAAGDTGTEYYPFKILTQFLNEAPRRMESRQTKATLKSPPQTVAKRKYFQETREQISKKSKEESGSDTGDLQEKNNPEPEGKEQMLDLFIADLDEINEIPFFDTSVPREVAVKIFHHLDMNSLCSCSQVSRSWHSLADDELLWFQIYLGLGLGRDDANLHVSHDSNWKVKVRLLVEEKRLLHANWKLRTGKPYQLNYAQGGVLCAVHSHGSTVVAGYTSCNVRSWDTKTGDVCTFNASNTALVLDENAGDDALCRIRNSVQELQTSERFTAAAFAHGFVDVWSCEAGTEPIHTLPFNSRNVTSLALQDVTGVRGQVSQACVMAAAQGTRVQASHICGLEGQVVADFDMPAEVSQVLWLSDFPSPQSANLLVTCQNTISIKRVQLSTDLVTPSSHQDSNSMTEVHNVYWAPITAVSLRCGSSDLAVGFNVYAGAATQIKVNMYDLWNQHVTATLTGHTWVISTIHLPENLPNQLVTGSGDRKIRLYDLQAATFPMLTLAGHSAKVTCVEMDDWKIVSADEAGFVCVWDQRMARKLWDIHNRHPVEYCHSKERLLIIGNVPYQKFPEDDEFDKVSSLRYRGTVQVYDFLANQQRQNIPEICLSGYSEPEAYDYNIGLAVPYDQLAS